MIIGSKILFQWKQRKKTVKHDYSIASWDLSLMPAVQDDVIERMTGVHCDEIKCVVTKLHEPLWINKSNETEGKTTGDILHMFWLEFKYFQHKIGTFDKEARCLTNTELVGKYNVWHKLYSLPYTLVFMWEELGWWKEHQKREAVTLGRGIDKEAFSFVYYYKDPWRKDL